MAGKRARKNSLIAALKAKALAYQFTPEQTATFERLYRAARTQTEQDQVTKAIEVQANGWRTGTDGFSRVLQAASDIGELGEDEDEDDPAFKAILERTKVTMRR